MQLKNTIVLITGAAGGIGIALARAFAQEGASLVLMDYLQERLDACALDLKKEIPSVVFHAAAVDIRNREAIATALAALPKEFQQVDVLVNNAGIGIGRDKFHELDLDDLDIMIDTNLKGLLYMTRLIVPGMVQRQKGHIINISSIAALEPYPAGHVYCAAKAGVRMFSSALRVDLVDTHIRVTDIQPGKVQSRFSLNRNKGDEEKAQKEYEGYRPLQPEDVAETVLFAATRPEHVQINEIFLTSTDQATALVFHKQNT